MRKSDLLKALRQEILKHNLGTFVSCQEKVVQTGCAHCKRQFGTSQQLLMRITEDILPPLLDRLSTERKG